MKDLKYFTKYDDEAEALYDAGELSEAIALLEPAYAEFPERDFFISWRILLCYRELKQYEKCLALIESCVRRGQFFTLTWKSWDPVRALPDSEEILAENDRLKAEAQKSAKVRYEIHLPGGYSPDKPCPLHISMHCDSDFFGNNEQHSRHWKPGVFLQRGFIVVYLQSSQVMSPEGFYWEGDAIRRKNDIKECFEKVTARYTVDANRVILGGFSGGAYASIDAALHDVIPVKGFIALGPDKPEGFSRELCTKAQKKGVRGVILEGEQSDNEAVQEMASVFKAVGLPYEVYINKGIGHWYPDDLDEKLEKALSFIFGKERI